MCPEFLPPSARRRWRRVIGAAVLFAVAACTPQEPPKNPKFDLKRPARRTLEKVTLSGPDALPAQVIAELGSDESIVHFGRNGERGVLVARTGGKWAAGPVAMVGDKAVGDDAAFVELAEAPETKGPAALEPHGAGFVFTWAKPVAAGHELWAVTLDARGAPVGKPRSAGRTFEAITWIEVQSHEATPTTIVWETRVGARRTVFAAGLPKSTEMPEALHGPHQLARDAVGWQASTGPKGTLFAWVDGEPGRIQVSRLERGKPSAPTAVGVGATALSDVHMAGLADRFIVGWTDTSAGDHHVYLAHLDGDAKVLKKGHPVLQPVGGQALVGLTASEDHKRALLAWERDLGVMQLPRRIQLSVLGDDGTLGKTRAELDFHATQGIPHIVSDGGGFAALTMAPMTQKGEAKKEEPLLGPIYVRLNAQLGVRAAEPVRVAELKDQAVAMEGVPELVHGLTCQRGLCSLTATGSGSPALMTIVTLPARPSTWEVPSRRHPVAKPPFVTSLTTLSDVAEPIADVSSAKLADGRTLVAWVTHAIGFDKTADGPAPATATLAYRFIEDGTPGPVHVLSKRAISVGGVDVLPLEAGQVKGAVALIGWAGPANGSQIYGSLIDAKGGKKRQKTITKIVRGKKHKGVPNEVYDVDVASDGHGNFIFAWSDSRDGNSEVYVARVNPQLSKNKRDTRLTTSKGPSLEPQLFVTKGRVLVAFSDTNELGPADVFVAELDGKTLALKGQPRVVDESDAHSRTPRWTGGAGTAALSWIDEATPTTPAALRLVATDDDGSPTTAARRIRSQTGGVVTSRFVSCVGDTCRGLLGASQAGVLRLAPFTTPRESGAPLAAPISNVLGGGSGQDLMMTSANGSAGPIFFVQDAVRGARLRELRLTW